MADGHQFHALRTPHAIPSDSDTVSVSASAASHYKYPRTRHPLHPHRIAVVANRSRTSLDATATASAPPDQSPAGSTSPASPSRVRSSIPLRPAMGHKNKEAGGRKAAGGGEASAAKAKAPHSSSAPSSSVNFNPKDVTDPLELLDMCVAALHDKSSSAATREAALASLAGALEGGVVPLDEAADGRPLVIFAVCGVSIKRSAGAAFAREARLAYRAVGLLALTLHGGGSTEILAESFPTLARTLQQLQPSSAVDPTTAAAALDCLAAVTFAGALGAEDAERSLKAIWGVVCPNPSKAAAAVSAGNKASAAAAQAVTVAALSTWMFLLTTATITDAQRKADRAAWNGTVASIAALLHADDRAVRMAAGEALAVCVELNLAQHVPRKDMDALKARASDLAAEAGGKGADRALLLEQKELFRLVSAYLERGERPSRALQTSPDRRKAIRVSSWAKLVQLNFLRRFLAAGFLGHVRGNKLFKEAFDAGADEKSTLSIARRKMSMKSKDKVMKMNREQAWAAKNVYCVAQGGPPESNRPELLLKLGWH